MEGDDCWPVSPWYDGPYGLVLRNTQQLTQLPHTSGSGLRRVRTTGLGSLVDEMVDWGRRHGYTIDASEAYATWTRVAA